MGRRFFGCGNYGGATAYNIFVGLIHHLKLILSALCLSYIRGS
ncbi:unnamed protein product, partial [Linum tenue]